MDLHHGEVTAENLPLGGACFRVSLLPGSAHFDPSLDPEQLTSVGMRDAGQSDFKNRVLPHTQILVAEERNACGYFSIEISGGASIHVDMLRKQINPFEKLRVLKSMMPDTLFQTLVRGINLFGYRPYPDNVVRLTIQHFAEVIDVFRVFDFLNYVPNMIPVFEEVKRADRVLEPAICFSTGPEHTDAYYVKKVGEILDVTGEDVEGTGLVWEVGDADQCCRPVAGSLCRAPWLRRSAFCPWQIIIRARRARPAAWPSCCGCMRRAWTRKLPTPCIRQTGLWAN